MWFMWRACKKHLTCRMRNISTTGIRCKSLGLAMRRLLLLLKALGLQALWNLSFGLRPASFRVLPVQFPHTALHLTRLGRGSETNTCSASLQCGRAKESSCSCCLLCVCVWHFYGLQRYYCGQRHLLTLQMEFAQPHSTHLTNQKQF